MEDYMEQLSIVAAEQRREFMAAGAVQSDLELAYRLQLEEAMAASAALQPSSSQPPPPISITISIHDGTDLQTLELEKLVTEIKNRLIIATETKKLQVDVHLNRLHVQKPYDDNADVFRVYFKGLLSEERVRGPDSTVIKVTTAGIGVVICDSKDEMIFDMRKPLELVEGDPICTQRVEEQALIEALKAATDLNLKRVVFCFDYLLLYQFVCGEWPPKQQKTTNILDQVNLFRKSFIYCEFSLIDRNDVNFAFKLAKEAIESQISKVIPTQEQLESCVRCLDDKPIHQFLSIEGCTHRYCQSCVKRHTEVKLLNGVLPKCPHEGCGNALRFESCEKFLNPKFTEMMRQRVKEESALAKEKVYCPCPKCSALMSNTEVLNRFHHRKPALEISQMPEHPYGEGSSSSSKNKVNPEVYRAYFKGLLSEERVRGPSATVINLTMAGIGVAICDSKGELIFELRKPLKLIQGDPICTQRVEGEALIEAMNAATNLDFDRVVFYCDNYQLYQFVSGRWPPKQQKTINILDQVILLQKSFKHCKLSLIDHKDNNFAFKLAREAIKSQIKKVIPAPQLENCLICLDDKPIHQFFSTEGCIHRTCYDCIKQHVEVKLLNGMLPKCPHEGCGNELRFEICEKFLNLKFTEMMRQRVKEESIPVTEKVYCPYPKCSTLMSRSKLSGLPELVYGFGARMCYECRGIFCIDCRVPWHENIKCSEYKKRNATQDVEESNFKSMAARNLWRQCIKCKRFTELAAGCYHTICRCGYESCYTCGAEWKNCSCPLWEEESIVDTEEEDYENDEFNDFGDAFDDSWYDKYW